MLDHNSNRYNLELSAMSVRYNLAMYAMSVRYNLHLSVKVWCESTYMALWTRIQLVASATFLNMELLVILDFGRGQISDFV